MLPARSQAALSIRPEHRHESDRTDLAAGVTPHRICRSANKGDHTGRDASAHGARIRQHGVLAHQAHVRGGLWMPSRSG